MEGGHDGPVVRLLHLHGVRVHAHVEGAVPETEDQQGCREGPRLLGETGQHQGHAAQHSGRRDDGARTEPVGQTPADLHAGEGPGPQQHEEPAQGRVTDAHAFLDGRDLYHPHAQQHAIEDEIDKRHDAGDAQRSFHVDTITNTKSVRNSTSRT